MNDARNVEAEAIRCAGCGKDAPRADQWPEGWIGVRSDGSVFRPFGGGAHVTVENLPSSTGNDVVCSEACLGAVRERRLQAAR